MISLLPNTWTHYTATAQGDRQKFVRCEHCSVEFVYVMQREATGAFNQADMFAGESMITNNDSAVAQAKSAAVETLASVLDNDFDTVPCPACGCYQRYMFPKLLGNTGLWVRLLLLAVIVIGCLAAVIALYRTTIYLLHPTDDGFGQLVTAWFVLLPLGLAGAGLSIVSKVQIRRFNPNVGDAHARIAIGRQRAVTREELDKAQAPPEESKGPV